MSNSRIGTCLLEPNVAMPLTSNELYVKHDHVCCLITRKQQPTRNYTLLDTILVSYTVQSQ